MRLDELVARIRAAKPPAGMTTRIVAVDGPGGAGKTRLANRLARELDAAVVHTDDFASWENPVDWWPRVRDEVLEPLARGDAARFRTSQWEQAPARDEVVEPRDFVILEGVTASREAFRAYLAYAIWVETPRELRLARGLERDGEPSRAQWEAWMAAEDAYVAREGPHERADAVVSGVDEDP